MANGNILLYLEKHPTQERLPLVAQSAHGLQYLHQLNPALVHGDMKASNILIDDAGRPRLTDFGLITFSSTQSVRTTQDASDARGSVRWMAPELFMSNNSQSRASDVYAFGMTILEVYTGKPPFSTNGYINDIQVLVAVNSGVMPKRPTTQTLVCALSDELWGLVERCWQSHPDERPNLNRITEELDSLASLTSETGIWDTQSGNLGPDYYGAEVEEEEVPELESEDPPQRSTSRPRVSFAPAPKTRKRISNRMSLVRFSEGMKSLFKRKDR